MYDLIIIGAGPAGLTASIYASCFHLKHVVIGKEEGGQLQLAPDILNYPGFSEISGKELTKKMVAQTNERAEFAGIIGEGKSVVVAGEAVKVTRAIKHENTKAQKHENTKTQKHDVGGEGFAPDNFFEVATKDGEKYSGRAVILATGMERRKLNVPGEAEYTGKGIFYCATCEQMEFKDKVCGVIGGANSAVQAAVTLSQAAKKVYLIYRGGELRGEQVWLKQIKEHPNIEVLYKSQVKEILGDGEEVAGIKLQDNNKTLPLERIFIEIGGVPGTALVIPLGVETDKGGYIKVDEKLRTNIPGIFAAGDMVHYGFSIEQIASAVGLGARAAFSAFEYLKKKAAPTAWGESRIER